MKMEYGNFFKSVVMHFIIAVIITLLVSFVLSTVKIDNLAYLGVLFGLYVFACYGVNRLIEDNIIEENYQRFIVAILCIIIFYLFFVYLMPFMFNMNVFSPVILGNDLILDSQAIFIIFSIIVLITNYFSRR